MPATPTTPGQSPCSPDRRPPSTRPAPGPPHGAAPTTTGPQTREPHVVPETPTELEQVVACKTSYQPTINYLRDTLLAEKLAIAALVFAYGASVGEGMSEFTDELPITDDSGPYAA